MLRQHTAGVAEPKRAHATQCPARATVRSLVIERGHLGVTNALVQSAARCDTNRAGSVLADMTAKGQIYGAKVHGIVKHWFASQELAMRWLHSARPPNPPARPARQRMVGVRHIKEPTAAQNMAVVRRELPGVTIWAAPDNTDTPPTMAHGVMVQRLAAATHDARYQCAPGERPAGAGFGAAGIGRDVRTGLAWGAQP